MARLRRAVAPVPLALLVALTSAALGWPGAPARLAPAPAYAQRPDSSATPDTTIPRPEGYVTDRAHLLDDTSREKLEAFLDQLQKKTGAQFAVLTVPTTAPLDPADYKVEVFRRWGVGKRGEDNGVILLVAFHEHRVWFETGYGLEGVLPDGLEARIIRQELTPRFRAGDYAGGITATVVRAAAYIAKDKNVQLEWNGATLRYDTSSGASGPAPWPALLVVFVVLIIVSNILRRLQWIGSSSGRRGGWGGGMGGWGGGWGGGFGGFGGGGGGGSFGGFGGGGSGGGGGGGSW
jgi:uncharacterized protein